MARKLTIGLITLSLLVAAFVIGRKATTPAPATATLVEKRPSVAAHAALPRLAPTRPVSIPSPIVLAPRLPTESVLEFRDEVDPGVRRCTSEAAARHAGFTTRLSITYRLAARDGRIRVLDTTVEDFDDDALAACVADAARAIELAAVDDQQDGQQSVTVFFDL